MKNKKIFFPILAIFSFAALPAFGNNFCPTCPDNEGQAVQPIEVLRPNTVTSISEATDAITLLVPEYDNGYLHIAEMIQGRVPGVWVTGTYNTYRIRIRGALGPPLLVLDGMPFYNYDDAALNNLLWSIAPADVDRIEVLRSLAEASLYSQAGNGVIRVFTRRGTFDGGE
ncbi:MAG: TonB-dependent receptor plug domain-containing protein [Phaeodactylibacter sp.]|nr:TonB-dependent receptor plug domain-containing protein [Phaeodactylibacter sp.]